MNPTVKITLQQIGGAVSTYRAAQPVDGAIREAIVTCFAPTGPGLFERVELVRADLPGAEWSRLVRASAVPELQARMVRAALDLADHRPHVVVTLDDNRALTNARLVTCRQDLAQQMVDGRNRSMPVPHLLPYQIGGDLEGATAVIYSPAAGGGLQIHSVHPTHQEAAVALAALQSTGESKATTLKVATSVTSLLNEVARGEYVPPAARSDIAESTEHEPTPRASLRPSPLQVPATMSPFAAGN